MDLTENESLALLLDYAYACFGDDGIQRQLQQRDLLIETLRSRGTVFDRDWFIEEIDQQKKQAAIEVLENLQFAPFLLPFWLYCSIEPEDISGRDIVSKFIDKKMEDFFCMLATYWALGVDERQGKPSFVTRLIGGLYDRYHFCRWVDHLAQKNISVGNTRSIAKLRQSSTSVSQVILGKETAQEFTFDYSPYRKITIRYTAEGIELDITVESQAQFDMPINNLLDNLSCDLMNLFAYSAQTDQSFRRKLTTHSAESDQARSASDAGVSDITFPGQFESSFPSCRT